MQALSLLLVDVWNLVQATVADQPSMWKRQVQLLTDDRLLNFHDLCDVIRCRPKFSLFDAIINSTQDVLVDVVAVVNTAKVLDKVVRFHSSISFDVWGVKVRVQHDDCKGQHEDLQKN